MREYLLQLKTQAIELWQKMSRIQKIILGGSAVLLIGTLILMARGATKPDYGALFTQLDDQQAGQIIAKLKEKKILYQLSDGGGADAGTTILVPTKDITQTRLELAGEGQPTGGVVGFENFEKTSFGETDTDRRARYLRALQGELTRTIEGMAEVDKARVHIVLPEPSLFIDEQKNATAAVMLKLKPNQTVEEGQIKGLVKLISNSVEGLKPENVTIVDMSGNNLSEDLEFDKDYKDRKLTVTQIDLQKQYQKELQNKVQSMLEKIYGPGKAIARLQLELDFDKIQKKSQEFGPNKVARSTQASDETTKSTTTANPGVPGTSSNIPGYVTTQQNGTSESTKSDKIVNNEINTYEQTTEVALGSVKRLSVAVVVDKDIDTKEQKKIEDVVKGASGFEAQRGDQISVAGMPFNTDYQDSLNRELAAAEKQKQMMLYGGLAALALLVIGGIMASIIAKRRRAKALEIALASEKAGLGGRLGEADGEGFDKELKVHTIPMREEVEEPPKPQIETPAEKVRRQLHNQVEKVAKEHPDDMAQLLRTWLAEE